MAFAIERKSLDDFLGTVFGQWERFVREIGRMEGAGFSAKVIIVESDFRQFCFLEQNGCIVNPKHNHPMLSPQAVMARLAELSFMGVSVLFCGDSQLAAAMAYALLVRRNKELEESTNGANQRNGVPHPLSQ